mgnify:CR=1 FL=1
MRPPSTGSLGSTRIWWKPISSRRLWLPELKATVIYDPDEVVSNGDLNSESETEGEGLISFSLLLGLAVGFWAAMQLMKIAKDTVVYSPTGTHQADCREVDQQGRVTVGGQKFSPSADSLCGDVTQTPQGRVIDTTQEGGWIGEDLIAKALAAHNREGYIRRKKGGRR